MADVSSRREYTIMRYDALFSLLLNIITPHTPTNYLICYGPDDDDDIDGAGPNFELNIQ